MVGGIAFFAVLFGATWLLADRATQRRTSGEVPVARTFEVGRVVDVAEVIERDGPILYPDLRDASGTRSIVIDHTGDDPARGWQVYAAHPDDRDASCLVRHVPASRDFVDCEGRTIDVSALRRPLDARPIVENRTTLLIDLSGG
ncbi:MAG: hypothetical protein ACKORC_07955 [Acidimicrobiia bacterium]